MADQSLEQEGHGQHGARPTAGGVAWRGGGEWPGAEELGLTQQDDPRLALWVPGSYACLQDLYLLSIPEDQGRDYSAATLRAWLLVGASKVNEHLFNRGWAVPLKQWSATVVWANCELAYCGSTLRRGVNSSNSQLDALRMRYLDAKEWLKAAQERDITPDARLSRADEGSNDFRYMATEKRGWAQPAGYARALGQFTRNGRF